VSTLAATGLLVRAIARRDRTRIAVWVVATGGLVAAAASGVQRLYPTQADLDQAAAASADSAVARAFKGPPLALATVGGQVAFQITVFGAIGVALMSLLLVSRWTRGEEESGRLELVRALPVGRRAPLAAALLTAAAADVAVGVIVAGGLLAEGLPATGSALMGAALAAVGLVFAALTAVTAQLTENARAASGLAGAVLGAAFVVRAVGDVGSGAVSWLSPIGWAQKTRPFAGDVAWPLLLAVGVAIALALVAVRLLDRRDLGAGLVQPRPGPARAPGGLSGAGALARRLQRGGAMWWALGILLLGVAYGSLAASIDDFVGDNQAVQDVIARRGGSLVDSFLATALLILALVAAGFAVQSALRLRGEETAGRAEVVLAAPVGRPNWLRSHLAIAFGASAIALVAGGAGLGLLAAIATGDLGVFPRVTLAGLAYVPAVWVLTAFAVALFGLLPRWTALAWAPLAGCLVVGMFGTLLDLPRAVRDLSPFELTPSVPAADWAFGPLVALVLVAAAVTAVGIVAFRHRDVPA
jgi:polyether ionophore transport system permease protein